MLAENVCAPDQVLPLPKFRASLKGFAPVPPPLRVSVALAASTTAPEAAAEGAGELSHAVPVEVRTFPLAPALVRPVPPWLAPSVPESVAAVSALVACVALATTLVMSVPGWA